MKKILLTNFLIFQLAPTIWSQPKFCADSSIRIKYTTPGDPFGLSINPDTTGKNIFTGTFSDASNAEKGLVAVKTNWGDSIYWAKKYFSDNNVLISSITSIKAPNGTLILTGKRRYFSTDNFLIARIDTNGNMLWARHLPLIAGGVNYALTDKNIIVTNNAIYFGIRLSLYDIIGKMDLNGNLIWSKGFILSPSLNHGNHLANGLSVRNGIVYFPSNRYKYNSVTGNRDFIGVTISKLNDADGSFIEGTAYSIVPDNFAKGFKTTNFYTYPDGSFSIVGHICITSIGGITPQSTTRFNIKFDSMLNTLLGYYYKCNIASNNYIQFDFTVHKKNIFSYSNLLNQNKYFISYDSNQQILRSRKFVVPTSPFIGGAGINLDDKNNIHFVYNYSENNQPITEYARISDLTAANTLQCFGIDTASIFEQHPLTLTKEPFGWNLYYDNLLNCLPVTIFTEDIIVNKEVICKQISYCDSVKIKGDTTVCITGGTFRYTVFQNPECLKGINWQTDTTFATIINNEADTAVTLQFKKTGQFYLKAAVNNCVVADSMLVTVTTPTTNLQLNRDSLLCPGSSLLLSVNPLFKTYQWQDGSTLNSFTVTSPGLYRISATDSCGNVIKDSIRVSLVDTSFNISNNYTFCEYDTARVLLPAGITNINWQPTVSGILSGNRLLLYPQQPTVYNITAQRPPGCDMQKTIAVAKENCPEWVRFPSAFTPNGDGLNDNFTAVVSGQIAHFNLKIFNRYGQLLFTSSNPHLAWDGRFKGAVQPNGMYVFIGSYRFANGTEKIIKGTIMLLR